MPPGYDLLTHWWWIFSTCAGSWVISRSGRVPWASWLWERGSRVWTGPVALAVWSPSPLLQARPSNRRLSWGQTGSTDGTCPGTMRTAKQKPECQCFILPVEIHIEIQTQGFPCTYQVRISTCRRKTYTMKMNQSYISTRFGNSCDSKEPQWFRIPCSHDNR